MPQYRLPNYLGESHLGELLDYQIDLMREQRLYRKQVFERDAVVVKELVDNYMNTSSPAMRLHIQDTMKRYWDYVDPNVQPLMAPIIAGSPLDPEVEKVNYYKQYGPPKPQRPMKMPDEEIDNYKQRLAEYHYGQYLWSRGFQRFMGTLDKDAPLKESFPIGVDENGEMQYVVKYKDTPARIVNAKMLDLAKVAKEKKIHIGALLNDPVVEGTPKTVTDGGDRLVVRTYKDLVTNKSDIKIQRLPAYSEDFPKENLRKMPDDMREFMTAVVTEFNIDDVAIEKSSEKPGFMMYAKIGKELEEMLDTGWFENVAKGEVLEKADSYLIDRLKQIWPGWQFKIDRKEPPSDRHPFGKGISIDARPGEVYSGIDKRTGKRVNFVYDGEPYDVVYRAHDFKPLGSKDFVEYNLGFPIVPATEFEELLRLLEGMRNE